MDDRRYGKYESHAEFRKITEFGSFKRGVFRRDKNEEIEVVFVPGHEDTYYVEGNKLTINFFKLIADFIDETIKIEGEPMEEFVQKRK